MEALNKKDILLIKELEARNYTKNSMTSNSTEEEMKQFRIIKDKLKDIANYFSNKYNNDYGSFQSDYAKGNPLTRHGTLNRVWTVIYKGALNKQYAAQISFVINTKEECLDVGFYFGRASSHNKSKEEKKQLEDNLRNISSHLSDTILSSKYLLYTYNSLNDLGFITYYDNNQISMKEWLNVIKTFPQKCQIIAKLSPDNAGIISNSVIDLCVKQVLFLMLDIDSKSNFTIPPQTPEQRAKKAERLAEIGIRGELFIMEQERKKLSTLNFSNKNYPKHVSMESDFYGYDILSKDENENDIYIEVKTTMKRKKDYEANTFFMSQHEYTVYSKNKEKYKLYRVYDIYNNPEYEEVNLETMKVDPNGYIVSY